MSASARDKFRHPKGGPAGSIDAPELGPEEKVHIRRLSLGDARRLSESGAALKDAHAIVPLCVCDDAGNPVFGDDADSRAVIDGLPMTLVNRIADAAVEMNGGGAGAVAEAKKA